jgi:hypothetical protein
MMDFCARSDTSALIGAFGVTDKKESSARGRWLTAVALPASEPPVRSP